MIAQPFWLSSFSTILRVLCFARGLNQANGIYHPCITLAGTSAGLLTTDRRVGLRAIDSLACHLVARCMCGARLARNLTIRARDNSRSLASAPTPVLPMPSASVFFSSFLLPSYSGATSSVCSCVCFFAIIFFLWSFVAMPLPISDLGHPKGPVFTRCGCCGGRRRQLRSRLVLHLWVGVDGGNRATSLRARAARQPGTRRRTEGVSEYFIAVGAHGCVARALGGGWGVGVGMLLLRL